jgi:hypothetical protein
VRTDVSEEPLVLRAVNSLECWYGFTKIPRRPYLSTDCSKKNIHFGQFQNFLHAVGCSKYLTSQGESCGKEFGVALRSYDLF